jgi:hypothetical protein
MLSFTVFRLTGTLTLFAAGLFAQKPVLTEDFESGKLDPAVWD